MAVLPTGSDEAILRLSDGTVKQRNLLTGTEVWTVPGRAHRPLTRPGSPAPIIDHDLDGHHCAFCSGRYLETPPEKARVVRTSEGEWETLHGLGAEELGDTTMDPAKRVLLKVNLEDAIAADEIFDILMGDKVEPRREFIQKNAKYVENLDI